MRQIEIKLIGLLVVGLLTHSGIVKSDEKSGFELLPVDAPNWVLCDSSGQRHSLSDCWGRPVVLVFFLGHGCLHCVEQLDLFAEQLDEFKKRQVKILGISSEPPGALKDSVENYGKEPPLLLMSDYWGSVFREYGLVSDKRLHGTFLIDASGKIRWQHIGAEPYRNIDSLLKVIDAMTASVVDVKGKPKR